MQAVQPTRNAHQWPRQTVKSVDCRPRDLVVRITNWLDDKEEPAFDVETYIGGVYDWNESKCFTLSSGLTAEEAEEAAKEFAGQQIAKLL